MAGMAGRVVLMLMAVLVDLAVGQRPWMTEDEIMQLPDCDGRLKEPQRQDALSWQSDSGIDWFCPHFWPMQGIDVYSCRSGGCSTSRHEIGMQITRMDECRTYLSIDNHRRRVVSCMPWEVNPDDGAGVADMRHLRAQFSRFRPMRQWHEANENVKDQSDPVPNCETIQDEVFFSNKACVHVDSQVVWLKPVYKFNVVKDNNRNYCVLSSKTTVGPSSYRFEQLTHWEQPDDVYKAFTRCRFYSVGAPQDKFDFDIANDDSAEWKFKDIQFYDYRPGSESVPCTDSVTEACVDNVFSFYAKECAWVRQSESKQISLKTMLDLLPREDEESFVSYSNNGRYVMNLGQRKIEAWVNNHPWGGEEKLLDTNTASLYFKERQGFSCSGCQETGWALSREAKPNECGVPQPCVRCEPWERVDTPFGGLSKCNPTFEIRRCVSCLAHHVRSIENIEGAEKTCVPCPPLTPMRREGQMGCSACEHTQWFDASSPAGCVYFMSVADGLSFTGGARFDKAFVDQYRRAGSTRRPETVPALHYRNLVSDGNAWNASTSVEMCPSSSFAVVNMSVSSVLTSNVQGRRMRFRRWCGHAEILKYDDTVMQPLNCGSRRPAMTTSLGELVAGRAAVYTLAYERRFVSNRMAEVKLTMSDGFSCYYELRREGREEDCRYCPGTMYTKDCGPTYHTELDTPAVAGAGTCVLCDQQCSIELFPDHFFAATQFSCWSNGTERVRGSVNFGSLKEIALTMAASMNYWYKAAPCRPCAKVSDASVPQIVTRCGNKVWFETWHATDTDTVLEVKRPIKRFCCAIDNVNNAAGNARFDREIGTRCVSQESELMMTSPTSLCEKSVPDLATNYTNFCPPGWFLDRSAPGCAGVLTEWKRTCCKQCEECKGAGKIKTDKYAQCSGGTDYDTQLHGCVASCAEKNYEFNGTCYACESCV
jgi:hypothetical protein